MEIKKVILCLTLQLIISQFLSAQTNCFNCSSGSTLDSGLLACYPFSGNANDQSGNGFHGTLIGASLTTDRFANPNSAYTFNGSTQYIRLGDILDSVFARSPIAQFSISGWAKSSSWAPWAGGGIIIGKLSGGGTNGYQWDINHDNDGKVRALVANVNSTSFIEVESSTTIATGTWFNFILTFDGTQIETQRVKLYVNGSVGNTYRDVGTLGTTTSNTNQEVTIGSGHNFNAPTTPNNLYSGVIDDIRIYNRVLSSTEIGDINSLPNPNINRYSDVTICQGDSTLLSAINNSSYSYSWAPTTGLSNPNIANPYAKPTASQQYIVTISNGACTTTDTVMVNVSTNCCATCTTATGLNTGLVACYPFNENTNDESLTTGNGTNVGATLSTDRFGNGNAAYDFGTNKKISIPTVGLNNNNYTFSLWVKPRSNPTAGNAYTMLSIGNNNAIGDQAIMLANSYSGQTGFLVTSYRVPAAAPPDRFFTGSLPTINTWYHLTGVRDAVSGKLKLYINGLLAGEVNTTSPTAGYDVPILGFIGARTPGNFQYFDGLIDDVRIYNRALSDTEIADLYILKQLKNSNPISDKTICGGDSVQLSATGGTSYSWSPATGLSNPNIANPYAKPTVNQQYIVTISNGVCSTTDTVMVNVSTNCCITCTTSTSLNNNLVACYPFAGNTNDMSGNGHNGTIVGSATLGPDRFGNPNHAYNFNGTSSSISILHHNDFNFSPTGEFTISLWAKPASNNQVGALFVKSPYNANVFLSMWNYGLYQLVNKAMGGYANNSVVQSNTTFLANTTWYHVTVTYNNGRWECYVNGSLEASDYSQTKFITQSTANISIGKKGEANGDYFSGWIDDIRVYNRAITPQEVQELYILRPTRLPISTSVNLCVGDSTQLSASGGVSYNWSPTTGLNNPTIANPYTKPNDSIIYTVVVSSGVCSVTDTVKVNVNETIITASADQTICYGDSFQLSASGATSYKWIPGITLSDSTVPNPFAQPSDTTMYIVTGTLNGCSSNDTVTIHVKRVLIDAGPTLFSCAGDSVQLNATGATSYRWTAHSTLSDTTIHNPIALPTDTIIYTVVGTHNGCSFTDSVEVRVVPFINVSAGSDTAICFGDSVMLTATGANSYIWTPATTLHDDSIANPYAKPSDSTTYYVTGFAGGCFGKDTVQVFVKRVVADAGVNQTICDGDSIQLNASGGGTYNWTSSPFMNNSNSSNPFVSPTDTTTFFVEVTNNGCIANDSVTVNVKKVNADAGLPRTICMGDSAQLSATGGSTYAWKTDPTLSDTSVINPIAKPLQTRTYYVDVTNNGCMRTDSVEITVNNPVNINAGADVSICEGDSTILNAAASATVFTWSPSTGLSDTTVHNPYAFPVITTDYIVTGFLGVCYDMDTIRVTVNPLPEIDLGPDTIKCAGEPFVFLPTVMNGDVYSWLPTTEVDNPTMLNPTSYSTSNQTFILKVTNSTNNCSATDTVSVTVQKPTAQFTIDSLITGSSPFSVTPVNTSFPLPLTYDWEFADSIPSFYTNIEPTHTYHNPGIYTVFLTVTDDKGCTDTLSQQIRLNMEGPIFIPNVFTPNGDGLNDLFEVSFIKGTFSEMQGSIWNRWGAKIYEFGSPDYQWWNGTDNGQPLPVGVYYYIVEVTDLQQKKKQYHGTITLLN